MIFLSFHWKVGDRFLLLLPPSSGRRWRAAPEVGFALFRLRPTPCPSGIPLPSEGGRCLSSRFSLLPLEGGGAQRRRLASLFSPSANPLPFGHPPSMGRGDGLLIPLLPPSSGRRWRTAPEVGFALFSLQPTPALPSERGRWVTHPTSPSFLWKEVARSAGGWLRSLSPSANPLPFGHPPSRGRGVDGLLTHSSTLHYPFTENGFQILATFIELKMNLKIGQSHYF